jgi:ubiquinone/menaquinone biosynthesis C-methylase UbiE
MSFDRLAPVYRGMEWMLAGNKLQRCRLRWTAEVRHARRILLVGEGHGRFLEWCPEQFPHAQVLCVDASAAMLRIARERWQRSGGQTGAAQFVQAALPSWLPPAAEFDLLVTNFFFDCFAPATLERVIERLDSAAAPGANWLIADFTVPSRGWRRWRARLVLALAYGFFRRVTRLEAHQLTAPDPFLLQAGFQLHRRATTECGLLQSDWWRR